MCEDSLASKAPLQRAYNHHQESQKSCGRRLDEGVTEDLKRISCVRKPTHQWPTTFGCTLYEDRGNNANMRVEVIQSHAPASYGKPSSSNVLCMRSLIHVTTSSSSPSISVSEQSTKHCNTSAARAHTRALLTRNKGRRDVIAHIGAWHGSRTHPKLAQRTASHPYQLLQKRIERCTQRAAGHK